jgi:hypothetical protein
MAAEQLFSFCNFLVLPGWLMLVAAPRWKGTRLAAGLVLPLLMAVVYMVLVGAYLPGAEGGFGSLGDVATFFGNPHLLLAGWIHYLAFDLFIGSWEVRDAQALGIPHWAVVPCLVFTFLLGPLGLLCYWGLRGALRKRFLIE